MARLYINPTLEKSIRSYCEFNGIEDVNAFANRCAMQGFNIVKFGVSPKDNIDRENNGIKDIKKNASSTKKKESRTEDERKQEKKYPSRLVGGDGEEPKEESKPIEERKEKITVRRIQVIKKK
jgi:hypothetical protein